jgi:hypothetical protein
LVGRAGDFDTWNQDAFLSQSLGDLLAQENVDAVRSRLHRIPLPGILPGFISELPGVMQDDFDPANPGFPVKAPEVADDDGPDWLNICLGNDNPYLELRQPGSPGGIGYYRLATQVQLIDSPTTSCAVTVQAFTPAGLQNWGLNQGPTTFNPSMSFFHHLGEGVALQGFIGQSMILHSNLTDGLGQNLQYGMAVQRPLLPRPADNSNANVYLFFEALGRYRYESLGSGSYYTPASSTTSLTPYNSAHWDVLPGLQWRPSETLWMTSGFVMPVGPNHTDPTHLQITCSLQF